MAVSNQRHLVTTLVMSQVLRIKHGQEVEMGDISDLPGGAHAAAQHLGGQPHAAGQLPPAPAGVTLDVHGGEVHMEMITGSCLRPTRSCLPVCSGPHKQSSAARLSIGASSREQQRCIAELR